jgi:PEP-CTERM motif
MLTTSTEQTEMRSSISNARLITAGIRNFLLVTSIVFGGLSCFAQNFTNLNFESATGPNGNQPGLFPVATALPGWSVFYGSTQQSQIPFDSISTGATQLTLIGPDQRAIEGNYGLYFQGGETALDVSIRQTGLIPVGTMSIEFKAEGVIAYGPLLLSFGGQNISVSALATGPNYTLYGGDVSGFAGTTGQLEFSVPGALSGFTFNAWNLDSIVFSPSPVPEPATCALILAGLAFLALKKAWPRS